jgi:hypothetical protein
VPPDSSQTHHPDLPEQPQEMVGEPPLQDPPTAPEAQRGFAPIDPSQYEVKPAGLSSLFAHFKAGPTAHPGELPPPNPLDLPFTGAPENPGNLIYSQTSISGRALSGRAYKRGCVFFCAFFVSQSERATFSGVICERELYACFYPSRLLKFDRTILPNMV